MNIYTHWFHYGTPMVAKFDSLFLVDAENIYSIYCKFYSIIWKTIRFYKNIYSII